MMARRDNTDPDDTGVYPNWAFVLAGQPAHPLQPRLGRSRRQAVGSEPQADRVGRRASGPATTCRTSRRPPSRAMVGPFIMNPEGTARLFARGMMRDGPFPVHYEPFESRRSPIRSRPKIRGNPVARVFKDDLAAVRRRRGVPLRGDLLPADRALPLLDQARPAQRGAAAGVLRRDLARSWRRRRASQSGGWVRVWSKRGSVKAKAVVTKRIKPLMCDGKTVHIVGIPLHWGFIGAAQEGLRRRTRSRPCRRRQHRDAGVQGVPGRYRAHRRAGGIREERGMIPAIPIPVDRDPRRRSASRT